MTEQTETKKEYQSWAELIENTTVLDLVKATHTKNLVTLQPNLTLQQAIEILSTNKILSAPVIDPTSHVYHGMVDYLDITSFIVSHWRKYSRSFNSEFFPNAEFFSHPITEVLNFSKTDYPVHIGSHASLSSLIELFTSAARPASRVHRVAVLQEVHSLLTVVSQSDLVKFLLHHHHLLKSADKTIDELGLSHAVIVAKADDPVSEVLELMSDHLISGLPLVDQGGHLVGQLSTTDMKGMNPNSVDYFLMNAKQFAKSALVPKYVVTCRGDSLLKEVLRDFTTLRLHRMYVVTKEDYVTGIITLTDVIRFIAQSE